jgi:hypothetical protein
LYLTGAEHFPSLLRRYRRISVQSNQFSPRCFPPPFRNSPSAKGQKKDLISYCTLRPNAKLHLQPGLGASHVLPPLPSSISHLASRTSSCRWPPQTSFSPMKRGTMSPCRKQSRHKLFPALPGGSGWPDGGRSWNAKWEERGWPFIQLQVSMLSYCIPRTRCHLISTVFLDSRAAFEFVISRFQVSQ